MPGLQVAMRRAVLNYFSPAKGTGDTEGGLIKWETSALNEVGNAAWIKAGTPDGAGLKLQPTRGKLYLYGLGTTTAQIAGSPRRRRRPW